MRTDRADNANAAQRRPAFYYNETFYSQDLPWFAERFKAFLPENVTALVTCSSSGMAIAAAMLTLYRQIKHIYYIRKRGEISHAWVSGRLEDEHGGPANRCFVDDFTDSGKTIASAFKEKPFCHAILVACNNEVVLKDELSATMRYNNSEITKIVVAIVGASNIPGHRRRITVRTEL